MVFLNIELIDDCFRMPPGRCDPGLQKLKEEDLDFAKTYRVQRDDGAFRRIISTVYNAIFQLFFPGLNSRDVNSKPKVVDTIRI